MIDTEIKAAEYTTGGRLMRKRIKKNWEIEHISTTLNIPYVYIKAIEDGDLDALPEMVYVMGFIRSYGDLLSLNTDTMVAEYRSIMLNKNIENYKIPDLPQPSTSTNYVYAIAGLILIGVIILITTNKLSNKSDVAVQDNFEAVQSASVNKDNFEAIQSVSVNKNVSKPNTALTVTKKIKAKTAAPVAKKKTKVSKRKAPYPKGAELSTSITILSTKITYLHVTSPAKGDAYNGFLDEGQQIMVPLNKGYMISSSDSKNLIFVLVDKKGKKYKLDSTRDTLNNLPLNSNNIKNLIK